MSALWVNKYLRYEEYEDETIKDTTENAIAAGALVWNLLLWKFYICYASKKIKTLKNKIQKKIAAIYKCMCKDQLCMLYTSLVKLLTC